MSDLPELVRWESDRFADGAWLGDWYVGSLIAIGNAFVLNLYLPGTEKASLVRTEHNSAEDARAYAEHRVRDFLAFARLAPLEG